MCVYKGKKKAREKDCRRNGPANKEMATKIWNGKEKKKKKAKEEELFLLMGGGYRSRDV